MFYIPADTCPEQLIQLPFFYLQSFYTDGYSLKKFGVMTLLKGIEPTASSDLQFQNNYATLQPLATNRDGFEIVSN